MNLLADIYKAFRKVFLQGALPFHGMRTRVLFFLNGVQWGHSMRSSGVPYVHVTRRGKVSIGNNFSMNNGRNYNVIGRQQDCIFWVEGELIIGSHTGMSGTALICRKKITIGDHVKFGGNCVVYDTDFHAIDLKVRMQADEHTLAATAPVIIHDNAFIGAHSTILKGVTIGRGAVVGACSVVTRDIPDGEVWAGNPARFIKKLADG
jgi:acetyltransferase-like isoleucine patch superfamily enzyme